MVAESLGSLRVFLQHWNLARMQSWLGGNAAETVGAGWRPCLMMIDACWREVGDGVPGKEC